MSVKTKLNLSKLKYLDFNPLTTKFLLQYNYFYIYWVSEASPTLGCSIDISRDIYIVGMSRMSN